MSACIVAAQLVMLPMALLVGAKADVWGRKPIFLAAFAILPIRGVLYTLSDDRSWLVAVQLLDGVGAGIFGALTPLVLADLMRGTGRYNVSQGAVATMQGIGASLSNTVAGVIVVSAGYSIAFLTLAAIALVAFVVFLLAMPETGESGKKDPNEAAPSGSPARAAMPAISAAAAYTITRNRRSPHPHPFGDTRPSFTRSVCRPPSVGGNETRFV
jgi:MFS family permease